MIISHQKLIHMPVYTQSGVKLGHIYDLEIDVETHHIRKYLIGPRFIGKETYLVTPAQILDITKDKIIVEDTIIKESEVEPKKAVTRPTLDTPLMQRNENNR